MADYYINFSAQYNSYCVMCDFGGSFGKVIEYNLKDEEEAKLMIDLLNEQNKLDNKK